MDMNHHTAMQKASANSRVGLVTLGERIGEVREREGGRERGREGGWEERETREQQEAKERGTTINKSMHGVQK